MREDFKKENILSALSALKRPVGLEYVAENEAFDLLGDYIEYMDYIVNKVEPLLKAYKEANVERIELMREKEILKSQIRANLDEIEQLEEEIETLLEFGE